MTKEWVDEVESKPPGQLGSPARRSTVASVLVKSVQVAAVLMLAPAAGEAAPFVRARGEGAEMPADDLKSWNTSCTMHVRYTRCDGGAAAERVADAAVKPLALSWPSVSQVISLDDGDPRFPIFVANHVGDVTILD